MPKSEYIGGERSTTSLRMTTGRGLRLSVETLFVRGC